MSASRIDSEKSQDQRLTFLDLVDDVVTDNIGQQLAANTPMPNNKTALGPLACSCVKMNGFFRPQILSGSQLLSYIANGELDQVESALQQLSQTNRILLQQILRQKVRIADPAGRIFSGITAFQLAIWNWDAQVWEAIRQYLPDDIARQQLSELMNEGVEYEFARNMQRSSHYDFERFLSNYQEYVNNFGTWNDEERLEWWCNKIGGAQRQVPAVLAQHYCDNTPFFPLPNFRKERLFPRRLLLPDGTYWFSSHSTLGVSAALEKGNNRVGELSGRGWPPGNASEDFAALTSLYRERRSDLESLICMPLHLL